MAITYYTYSYGCTILFLNIVLSYYALYQQSKSAIILKCKIENSRIYLISFLQLILELEPYFEELSKTQGAISEFVNPK